MTMTRHLDLGCGGFPRNPYGQAELYGIDTMPSPDTGKAIIRQANLTVEPIPFPDSHFDSISAYDFIEHVPRIFPTADFKGTRAPFIELMNEIWRTLKPGGLFYASTPIFPNAAAFQDPTHVNIITMDTHTYFTRPIMFAKHYGFTGDFELVRTKRYKRSDKVAEQNDYEPLKRSLAQEVQYRLDRHKNRLTHIVWEFRAIKP